jgi:hypothetical protein
MRSNRVVRASDCHSRSRNSQQSWVDSSILRHSGIWREADEAVLNKVHKKIQKNPPVKRVTIRALYAFKGGYIIYKENMHKGHQEDLDYVNCHRPEISQVYTPNESQLYNQFGLFHGRRWSSFPSLYNTLWLLSSGHERVLQRLHSSWNEVNLVVKHK